MMVDIDYLWWELCKPTSEDGAIYCRLTKTPSEHIRNTIDNPHDYIVCLGVEYDDAHMNLEHPRIHSKQRTFFHNWEGYVLAVLSTSTSHFFVKVGMSE
jgi:hypothetical protein